MPEPNIGFVAVHTGEGSSCGVKDSGELVCWSTDTMITATVPESPAYTDIVLGAGGPDIQSCGLTQDGNIDCWASNRFSVDIPDNGPYSAIDSNYGWLCGLTTTGVLDCSLRSTNFTNVDSGNAALLNEVASLPPLSSFEILTQSSTITSICGLSLDGDLICIGKSLPADTLPGAPTVSLTDIPMPENLSVAVYSDTTIELLWEFSRSFVSSSRNIYRDGQLLVRERSSGNVIGVGFVNEPAVNTD